MHERLYKAHNLMIFIIAVKQKDLEFVSRFLGESDLIARV